MQNDSESAALIEKLAEAIAKLVLPEIPFEIDLWDIATIARFFKRDPQVVRERMACLPSFPKAVRLPTLQHGKVGRAQPLYWAREIVAWAKTHQEKS